MIEGIVFGKCLLTPLWTLVTLNIWLFAGYLFIFFTLKYVLILWKADKILDWW